VRINAVMPGSIDTPGADFAMQGNQQIKDAIASSIPLRRNGTSKEVANAILFLASPESSFITGVALRVDGGKWSELYTPDIDFTNYRK
jgi:NAD(P)-dependent dehydrogenase (short-subunit alcohol dehydrogenase family)